MMFRFGATRPGRAPHKTHPEGKRKHAPRRLSLESLEGRDMPSGWHNAAMPLDVTGDGQVTSADALAVVSYLRSNRADAPATLSPGASPEAWYDTSNDGQVTAIDALLVVNRLNSQTPPGQSPVSVPAPTRPHVAAVANPTYLMLTSDASDRITARWREAPGALGTVVSLRLGASRYARWQPGATVPAGKDSFVFTNLRPRTRYYVKVASIDGAGNLTRGIVQRVMTRQEVETNTHELDRALKAGIKHLGGLRDRDHHNQPFFLGYSLTREQAQRLGDLYPYRDAAAHLKVLRHFVSNVSARSLHAVLSASHALGVAPPADVVADYTRILLAALHKPRDGNWANTAAENQLLVGLASDPSSFGSNRHDVTYLFNAGQGLRGMLALATMTSNPDQVIPEYGRSYRQMFETSVYNLRKYYVYDGQIGGERVYDWEQFRQQLGLRGGNKMTGHLEQELNADWSGLWKDFADPHMIYPLIEYYEATGHQSSLDLAKELAEMAFDRRFPSDPALIRQSLLPHMFETVAEMNAYSALALATGNADMMDRVRLRYEYLKDSGIVSQTGWVPEVLGMGSDLGEANNTAELIETAINFSRWGWSQYNQDVERFTRAHLLPSQLLDTRFVTSNGRTRIDGLRDIRGRLQGAFGFPAPYGHISTQYTYGRAGAYFSDVSAGAIATLAEVQRHAYELGTRDEHRIHLLFDQDNDRIQVASPYPGGDRLIITTKTAGDVFVRMPAWADRAQIEQSLAEQGLASNWEGEYLRIDRPAVNVAITIPMPLPIVRESEYVNGRGLVIEWQGDSVLRMSPMGTPQPFFPMI